MPSARTMRLSAGIGLLLAAAHLGAQQMPGRATVSGIVHDSTGAPIIKAEVAVMPSGPYAFTDERGRYTLRGAPRVIARKIGFTPELLDLSLAVDGSVSDAEFVLDRVPPMLAERIISARRERLASVYERMDKHLGVTLFSEDLERYGDMDADRLMRFSPRLAGVMLAPRKCPEAVYYVDGRETPPANWKKTEPPATIGDFINASDIAAIEAFKSPDFLAATFLTDDHGIGAAPIPQIYRTGSPLAAPRGAGSCQRVVFIWTKYYVIMSGRVVEP